MIYVTRKVDPNAIYSLASEVTTDARHRSEVKDWRPWATLILDLVLTWQERDQERQNLAALEDVYLEDMGITRADVRAECAKPFWKP